MQELLNSLEVELEKLINDKLYTSFKSEIRNEHSDFESLQKSIFQTYENSAGKLSKAELKAEILSLISQSWNASDGQPFSEFSAGYYEAVQACLQSIPETLEIPQEKDRFTALKTDSFLLKLAKGAKSIAFGASKMPVRTANLFRKTKQPIHYWNHKIPLRAIGEYYLLGEYIQSILEVRARYYTLFSKAYQELKEWEESADTAEFTRLDFSHLTKSFSKVRKDLKTELVNNLHTTTQQLRKAATTVDTLEHSPNRYEEKNLMAHLQSADGLWQKEDAGWHNTFDAFFEEWRADLEVFRLISLAESDFVTYQSAQSNNLSEDIGEELEAIFDYIHSAIADLEKSKDEDFSLTLKKCNYRAQKTLDQEVIPLLVEKLSSNQIINAVNRFEADLNRALENLTTERKIAKIPTDYLAPIAIANITTISPYELIAFEITPTFKSQLDRIKGEFIGQLDESVTVARDLDHMITFGLSAAIQQLQEHPAAKEDAQKVAIESLRRSEERVRDIQTALADIIDTTNEQLRIALNDYTESLRQLTVNENVREIRMRVMKAKAIQQTEAYKAEMKDSAKAYTYQALAHAKAWLNKLKILQHDLSQRFILTSKKEAASKEVSDFLSESQEVINALPIIYRNLYRIEPLTDHELFVGRQQEYDQLMGAYANWEKGRMGSAVIIGEKWSGLTSYLNYIQHQSPFRYAVNRITCETESYGTQQLLTFLHGLLENDTAETPIQCVSALNEGPRRIIIVEDIQNLYLRKVGGFARLKDLLELISHTSKNIFWIATSTLYTWNYFQKTLNVQDVFSYHIKLQPPTAVELSNIVAKRNRISGYKILFDPSEDDLKSKKFKNLSEADQQATLKGRFFKKLIDFSESNISMALMFWLLSTKSVDQNGIVIGDFRKPDLGFLMAFDIGKVLALHQLILHDGLTLNQFTIVNRSSHQSAFLMLSMMLEDGILIFKNDIYTVNPLVYRSVISLLKAKNLIY